jgi:hypothetical protein
LETSRLGLVELSARELLGDLYMELRHCTAVASDFRETIQKSFWRASIPETNAKAPRPWKSHSCICCILLAREDREGQSKFKRKGIRYSL